MAAVLIVDDDDPIRTLVCRVLTREGHAVTAARHGGEAIECLSKRNFDALVLDVMMPATNGAEVLAFMRRERKWTPTILLTAVHEREIAALDTDGVHAIVRKPFDINVLCNAVATCVPTGDSLVR